MTARAALRRERGADPEAEDSAVEADRDSDDFMAEEILQTGTTRAKLPVSRSGRVETLGPGPLEEANGLHKSAPNPFPGCQECHRLI
jgi:hypothetical protein